MSLKNKQEIQRCKWCLKDDLYKDYHDNEWGIPEFNDIKLFEAFVLDCFQAGLSWYTILSKRNDFRIAFDNFDPQKIKHYDEKKIEELLRNAKIIRHRGKIEAAIKASHLFFDLQNEFGSFSNYIWSFSNNKVVKNNFKDLTEILSKSELSDRMSKDMKKRGFNFVGSITIYAYLQAIGVVNDHLTYCFKYSK